MSSDWEAKIEAILDKKLSMLKPPITTSPPSLEQVNDKHPTHKLEDLLTCPDCYPKIRRAVLEKEIVSRKNKELECVNCGTGVDEDEPECPTCGSKDARHRH